ncbi:transglutaminase family protein [Microbacterium halophytorum]|uniref:transglutaminase family protein n=1 Tax=Microbacterium halophytorum TaxID=2067568 RepID=UPI00131A3186|nr:transglutaminase domain-containing protein [Microbacterium halophytorum]
MTVAPPLPPAAEAAAPQRVSEPSSAPRAARRPRGPRVVAELAVWAAVLTALLPATGVFSPPWFGQAALAALAVVAAGAVARRAGWWAALAAEVVVWLAASAVAFPAAVVGGFLPWPSGAWAVPDMVATAAEQLWLGVPPLSPEPALLFVLVAAAGLIALLAEQLAVGAHSPISAVVLLSAVLVGPQLAVPRGDDLVLAVPLALSALWLLAVARPGARRASAGAGFTTAVISFASVTAAVVAAPAVPTFPAFGQGVLPSSRAVDVSLDLGNDLRNTSSEQVLTVRTEADAAPYLRLATNTIFDDEGWHVDERGTVPLGESTGFDAGSAQEHLLEAELMRARIGDVEAETPYLPLPARTFDIQGLEGAWFADRETSVLSTDDTVEGAQYTVSSSVVAPTIEAMRVSPWVLGPRAGAGSDAGLVADYPDAAAEVPDEAVSGAIGDTAREVTSRAATPYEAALSLQRWLRSPEFRYSLDAPVEAGYDGSDLTAVEAFLDERAGYCQHFASTFALMARSIGIPTRVVVGYLPGSDTGETVRDETVYSVSADRLHAWPEAYFAGAGWLPFEPTPSIARAIGEDAPDDLEDAAAPEPGPDTEVEEDVEPEPTATEEAAQGAATGRSAGAGGGIGGAQGIAMLVALVLLLAAPVAVRTAQRSYRIRAAARGDAAAAWRELRATALDARLDVSGSLSPRALGDRLIAEGASPDDVGAIVEAVERASYGPPKREPADPAGIDDALRGVVRALRPPGSAAGAARFLAPRSLWARGGLGEARTAG